ncbi:hypothetical protein IGB42_00440 [Andreprevotia sp. IGB-42]|uniref:hypothetical protein n=1 Tax=Andreprevotia sp. IGB-42 TaxID=2497473 RepID=UPI00135AF96A|nr:hypothetical protein [Andreprevotia sp. IGB-42]KAF0815359.1 hypothetical protein IGB42_00440 [Andreprevotia sp. IGB-42]
MNAPANPYAAPKSDLTVGLQPLQFTELDYKTLRRLRNDSHSVRAFGGLALLIALVSGTLWLWADAMDGYWLIVLGMPLLSLAAAYGCLWRPRWGQWLALPIAVISLAAVPLGTLVGGLAIVALLRSPKLFGPAAYAHSQLDAEFKYRRKHRIR